MSCKEKNEKLSTDLDLEQQTEPDLPHEKSRQLSLKTTKDQCIPSASGKDSPKEKVKLISENRLPKGTLMDGDTGTRVGGGGAGREEGDAAGKQLQSKSVRAVVSDESGGVVGSSVYRVKSKKAGGKELGRVGGAYGSGSDLGVGEGNIWQKGTKLSTVNHVKNRQIFCSSHLRLLEVLYVINMANYVNRGATETNCENGVHVGILFVEVAMEFIFRHLRRLLQGMVGEVTAVSGILEFTAGEQRGMGDSSGKLCQRQSLAAGLRRFLL
ncbi:hypothetical protein LXL04_026503 [Taraxacum kok-saghyz]